MRFQNIINLSVFLFLTILNPRLWAKGPELVGFIGQPEFINQTEGHKNYLKKETLNQALKLNQEIKFSFKTLTKDDQWAEFKINSDFQIIVFGNSEIYFEGYFIDKKNYELKKIKLIKGRYYLSYFPKPKDLNSIQIESDFFDFKNSDVFKNSKFYIDLNSTSSAQNFYPYVRFCAGSDGFHPQVFDHETKPELMTNQGIEFKAQFETDEVKKKLNPLAMDILLEGRKIPKGEWLKIFSCDINKILSEVTDLKEKLQAKQKQQKRVNDEIQKKIKLEYDKSLCHNPNAQYNECLWTIKNEQNSKVCFRFRCNGEGRWADETRVSLKSSQCETVLKFLDHKLKSQNLISKQDTSIKNQVIDVCDY